MTPTEIAGKRFLPGIRGYVREEVRSYLRAVADVVRTQQQRIEVLEHELEAYRGLDGRSVGDMVGRETTNVIDRACEAAEGIRAAAEREAAAILGQAQRTEAEARTRCSEMLAGLRQTASFVAELVEDMDGQLAATAPDMHPATAAAATDALAS